MMATKKADVAVTFHRHDGFECRIDEDVALMRLTYADGGVEDVKLTDLNSVVNACMWHGAKQKLIDAAAISRDPSNGRAASVAVKRAAVVEVLERMRAGHWFKPREGGAGSGGLLYRALCRFYEGRKSPEEVRAWLDGQDDAAQQALRRNSRVAAIIEELRGPGRGDATGFDADRALEEFGG